MSTPLTPADKLANAADLACDYLEHAPATVRTVLKDRIAAYRQSQAQGGCLPPGVTLEMVMRALVTFGRASYPSASEVELDHARTVYAALKKAVRAQKGGKG